MNGFVGNATLLQALAFEGGNGVMGAKLILMRAAVAALLNGAHPGVAYPLDDATVISQVQTAFASNDRDTLLALAITMDINNNLGCTLS